MERFSAEMIAPCGMNCKICLGYFGYTTTGKKRKMKCTGCKPTGKSCAHLKKHCKNKKIYEIYYCFECSDFPCEQLQKLDKKYRKRYDMSMIKNLEYIRDNGMKKFLRKQEKKYQCPECGGVICVHDRKCYSCNSIILE